MGIFRFIINKLLPEEDSYEEPVKIQEQRNEPVHVSSTQKQTDQIERDVRYYNNSSESHNRDDNMNCDLYEGRARFLKTNRFRNITLYVFPNETVESALQSAGYSLENAEVERSSFPQPTDAQLNAMKSHGDLIPYNVSRMDVSAIMDRIIDHDEESGPKYLFEFAEQHRIVASRFTGRRGLHLVIWNGLEEKERLGFFLLCVCQYKYGKWNAEKFEEYCGMYDSLMSDSSFFNSFNNFSNNGFYGFDSNTGTRSNAFKIAKEKVWI